MRKFALGLVALVLSTSASVADVPQHDPEAHCTGLFPDSAQMSNFCLEKEQSEYDALKVEWPSYSETSRSHCTKLFDESYQMLRFCLQEEKSAEGSKKPFKF